MRVLIIFCHPSRESFAASLLEAVAACLVAKGHEIIVRDLYRENFHAALTEDELRAYRHTGRNRISITEYVQDLTTCNGLLLIYPTWWYSAPALLKGYFDRVLVPGVAFELDANGLVTRHLLTHIRRFAVVTTYGSPWWWIKLVMGDPGQKAVRRGLRRHFAKNCRSSWFACYDMDRTSPRKLEIFRDKVIGGMRLFDDRSEHTHAATHRT